jgi:hypothetical protein
MGGRWFRDGALHSSHGSEHHRSRDSNNASRQN